MKQVKRKDYSMMRIGDGLEACIHRTFTNEADDMLYRGAISRDERILLSGAISKALDIFHQALPPDLAQRQPYMEDSGNEPAMAMPMMRESTGGFMEKVVNWLGLAKVDFDTSPWKGDAGQWDTAEAYCSDCLIDTNPSGEKKTKDRCHLPYRSPGSNKINKNALRAMASGGRGIPALKNVPAADKKKAAAWVVSHWKAAFDRPAPDSMYRMAGMMPPKAGEKSSVMFFKDKNQKWWVVLMYSNKYEDRENDIVSSAAHKKFAEFCQKSGFKPAIVLFHQPRLPDAFWLKAYKECRNDPEKLQTVVNRVYKDTGAAIAEAEHVSYLNGFALMIGKVFEDKYDVAERLSKMKDLGNSHIFIATDFNEKDDSGIIVNEYVSFEGTILPRSRAANVLTFTALKETEKAMTKSKDTSVDQQWLEQALGKDGAAALKENTKNLEENLDGLLAFKQAADDTPDGEETEDQEEMKDEKAVEEKVVEEKADDAQTPAPETAAPDEVVAKVLKVLNVEELQAVVKSLIENNNALVDQNKALTERVEALEGKVVKVEKSQDEQIASQYMPTSWGIPNLARPAESKDTEVSAKKAEALKKEGPALPEDSGAENSDNMLVTGFWKNLDLKPAVPAVS